VGVAVGGVLPILDGRLSNLFFFFFLPISY